MTREHQEAALTAVGRKERPGESRRGRAEERPEIPAADLQNDEKALASLFQPEMAADFRAKWDAIQVSFVDDPRNAVRRGDELVARVMKELAETFSRERAVLEKQVGSADETTENLRIALQRHRSFFNRLLSL